MKQFEIYFSDLNEKSQIPLSPKELLDLVGAKEASDMNRDGDIVTLAIVDFEDSNKEVEK